MNSLSISLSISRIHYLFHYLFREFTIFHFLFETGRFDSFLLSSTQDWPLTTFYDLIGPEIILNFNLRQNAESKHMYIWYISTNRADLTPIGQIWPKFDLWWPRLTLKNIKSEFLRKFRVETYVYLMYFDQLARFDPYWTGLTHCNFFGPPTPTAPVC